jgi:hypothetical protein
MYRRTRIVVKPGLCFILLKTIQKIAVVYETFGLNERGTVTKHI